MSDEQPRDEREPLSEERLMALKSWIAERPVLGEFETIRDLLAWVDRLRAELAAARAMVRALVNAADSTYVETRPYAGPGHSKLVGPLPAVLGEARALLASEASEREAGEA